MASNPLVRDRDVDFLLDEVHDVLGLCSLPAFADHSRETFSLFLASAAKLARERLFPLFRAMDEQPAELVEGRVRTHPQMGALWDQMVELGLLTATCGVEVGGSQLPHTVSVLGYLYLMAGNGGAAGYPLLTSGAAHLLESFASPAIQAAFMARMYAGEWTGTMSLTEPQAGSGLGDLTCKATPIRDREGVYNIQGSKIFISGGDHDFRDNVVHLTLARRVGDPVGSKGISLFAVPRMRPVGGDLNRLLPGGDEALEFNDVHTTQLVHKIGWKGLPSLGLGYGETGDGGDCMGWLVGEPCRGLAYMFQMMNEARLLVGANATATASAAYHEALAYSHVRTQGRKLARPGTPDHGPVAIIEHPDIRRMLLRSKVIVEGSMSLLVAAARYQDVASHHDDASERERAQLILDTLTPIAKTFPAERGFEVNVMAVQIHGGYGYSSECLPELWMREQKLNSIHEGTTGIQSLDLLGRKVVAKGGMALEHLSNEIRVDVEQARNSGVDEDLCETVKIEVARLGGLTRLLAGRGLQGDVVGMLAHSHDYLVLFGNLIIAWQWLKMAGAACRALGNHLEPDVTDYYRGKIEATRYWIRTELADNARLALLCETGEDSYLKIGDAGW
jgi:alkylation response protein AidB-like acyl-CoA dehydrogenase